jgi:hypothetical protein
MEGFAHSQGHEIVPFGTYRLPANCAFHAQITPQIATFQTGMVRLRHRPLRIPLGLTSANGERRAESPRREGRRLPPLSELDDFQRREFHEALLEAATFEDLPGKWQAAILKAEQNRPKLRIFSSD